MTQHTPQDSQSELEEILDKYIAPAWLQHKHKTTEVPAYGLHMNEAKQAIEAYVTTRVKEAERQGAENIINDLISKDAFAEDFEVKELLKTVRTALATTTNGKETK